MKQPKQKKNVKNSSKLEKISAQDALTKVKNFTERKEKMIASIIASKN